MSMVARLPWVFGEVTQVRYQERVLIEEKPGFIQHSAWLALQQPSQ